MLPSVSNFCPDLNEPLWNFVSETAIFKNPKIKINPKDKYLVLSTCREEDSTLRANLYLRLVPDDELKDFLSTNSEKLKYKKTR